MRPDQHKKKRSADYKKKHNLQSAGSTSKEQSKVKQPSGKTAERKHNIEDTKQNAGKVSRDQKESLSSENEEAPLGPIQKEHKKPSFQRRKIVSNWDRYEIKDDADVPETRGEDFCTLLSVNTSSSSQFRFKDEHEWQVADMSWLSLDCADLARAIRAIPLHTRLNIPDDVFEKDQIELFTEIAARNRLAYEDSRKTFNADSPLFSSCDVRQQSVANDLDTMKTEKQSITKNDNDVESSKNEGLISFCNSKTTNENESAVYAATIEQIPLVDDGDDLDFLLSLETPVNTRSIPVDFSSIAIEIEDENKSSPVSPRKTLDFPSPFSATNMDAKKKDNEIENADDAWLDSLLE